MLKLLKYEFRKTMSTHLILIALTAAAEICFLIGINNQKTTDLTSIGIALLVLIAIAAILMCGITSVASLHRDMNTKQSYMLFMTPHGCPAILGAKVLECVLSILLFGCLYGVLALVDLKVLLQENSILNLIKSQLIHYIRMYDSSVQLSTELFVSMVFAVLSAWICVIMTAFFADIMASSLLNGRRMNGLLTFALFLVLNIAIPYIFSLVPVKADLATVWLTAGLERIAASALMYIASSLLMSRYLSV